MTRTSVLVFQDHLAAKEAMLYERRHRRRSWTKWSFPHVVKNPPKCREGVQGKKRLQVKKIPAQDGSASGKIRQNSEKPDKSKQPM